MLHVLHISVSDISARLCGSSISWRSSATCSGRARPCSFATSRPPSRNAVVRLSRNPRSSLVRKSELYVVGQRKDKKISLAHSALCKVIKNSVCGPMSGGLTAGVRIVCPHRFPLKNVTAERKSFKKYGGEKPIVMCFMHTPTQGRKG